MEKIHVFKYLNITYKSQNFQKGISGQVMKIIDFSPQDISGQVMKMIDFSPQHNWHVENILFLRHFRWLNKSVAWWIQYTTIVHFEIYVKLGTKYSQNL